MFTHKTRPLKKLGVRYFFKERRFPWSPYLKDVVYKYPAPVEDNSLPAEYPKIEDLSSEATNSQLRKIYYDKIKALNTVEEKLIALNLPKFYGWPTFHLKENQVPYDYLPFAQYITRSVISEQSTLPLLVSEEQIRPLITQLKAELEKVLIFELQNKRLKLDLERKFLEEEKMPYFSPLEISIMKTKDLVKQMNSAIIRVMVSQYPHLLPLQVDFDPRLEAFWRVGGFHPTKEDRELRKAKLLDEYMIDAPIDRFFQYFGSPLLQLRSKLPLSALPELKWQVPADVEDETLASSESLSSSEQPSLEKEPSLPESEAVAKSEDGSEAVEESHIYPLQSYRYRPDTYLRIKRERIHGAVIPGFWPNDPHRFGVLSYHSCNHVMDRPESWGDDEHKEARHAQAIIGSFAFTYGQACYQGFSTYNDVTYPFVSQSILTDGQRFSCYQYQLNTAVLHSDNNENTNPKFNMCYATPPQELYHSIENDRIIGWNNAMLVNLFSLYTNVPKVAEMGDLCPYLNKKEKYAAQIEEKKKRVFLHNKLRYLSAHRSWDNRRQDHEIYDWERIFKIEHQVRVTDARKRHFEKFEDWINDRKLNEHYPPYVPKKLREPGRAKMDKWEDIYYPNVYPAYHEIV